MRRAWPFSPKTALRRDLHDDRLVLRPVKRHIEFLHHLPAALAATFVLRHQPSSYLPLLASITGQITVQVVDQYGNAVSQSGVSVGIATTSGLSSTSTTPLSTNPLGYVVFSDLTEDFIGNYTLAATSSLTGATSNSFTITAAATKTFTYVTQPSSVAAGTNLGLVTLQAVDQYGNITAKSGIAVTIGTTSGTALGGTLSQSTATGPVVYNDLVENTTGTYTLTATSTGLTNAVSSSFVISVNLTGAKLAFVTSPGTTVAGAIFIPVTVQATDQFNNKLPNVSVGISISPNTLSSGTTPLTTNASGQVVFTDLSEDLIGSYTLTAALSGGASITSGNLHRLRRRGERLTFTSQPINTTVGSTINPITLQVVDTGGNVVAKSGVSVALTIPPGTFSRHDYCVDRRHGPGCVQHPDRGHGGNLFAQGDGNGFDRGSVELVHHHRRRGRAAVHIATDQHGRGQRSERDHGTSCRQARPCRGHARHFRDHGHHPGHPECRHLDATDQLPGPGRLHRPGGKSVRFVQVDSLVSRVDDRHIARSRLPSAPGGLQASGFRNATGQHHRGIKLSAITARWPTFMATLSPSPVWSSPSASPRAP